MQTTRAFVYDAMLRTPPPGDPRQAEQLHIRRPGDEKKLYDLRYGKTDPALKLIEQANRQVRPAPR